MREFFNVKNSNLVDFYSRTRQSSTSSSGCNMTPRRVEAKLKPCVFGVIPSYSVALFAMFICLDN